MPKEQSLVDPDAKPPEESKNERPDWLPEHYWDSDGAEAKVQDMAKALADSQTAARAKEEDIRKRIAGERAEDLPVTKEAYQLPDLELPAAVNKADLEADPMVAMAREWAHNAKVTQNEFNSLVKGFIQEQVKSIPDPAAETAKLGDNAGSRITRLDHLAQKRLSEGELEGFRQFLTSAEKVVMLEKLLEKGGGPGDFEASETTVEALKTRREAIMNDKRYYVDFDKDLNTEVRNITEKLAAMRANA